MTDSRWHRALRFSAVYGRAALGSAYALTLGLAQRRHRGLLTDVARHFGYDQVAADATLPVVPLADVVPADVPVRLRELRGVDGNVSPLELIVLTATVASTGASTVFEIGTFDGRTALNLAANAAPGGVVYTLDLPAAEASAALAVETDDRKYMPAVARIAAAPDRANGTGDAATIQRVYGDSASFDFSPYHGRVDVCFVDGAHSYEYVMSDSQRALEMSHSHSVIFWHDYGTWRGVTAALNELQRAGGAFARLRRVEGTALAILDRRLA